MLVCYYTTWTFVASGWNKILSDSFNCITINQAHSIVWFERRHQRLWLLERLFGSWRRISRNPNKQAKKSHIPCSNFGESRFLGKSPIPNPVKVFIVFPIPAPYFGKIPDPENTLPDPVGTMIRASKLMTMFSISYSCNEHLQLT